MVKLRMFGVYDVKAGAFLPPFFMPETGMAMRVFVDCVRDPNHGFGKHPEDYTLFYFGQFRIDDGVFEPYETGKQVLCTGIECLAAKRDQSQLQLVNDKGEVA